MDKKKLEARDVITIGIFTAILWVVQLVIMYLGYLSPFIVAGYAVLIPIVTGIPMMLYYARIEKFGMLTITSVIVAILLFIFGMGLTGAPICIASGLFADLIAKLATYTSLLAMLTENLHTYHRVSLPMKVFHQCFSQLVKMKCFLTILWM